MDAASIEQMNKVRASLGMAPLPVPGKDSSGPNHEKGDDSSSEGSDDDFSTYDKRYAAADNNWQKLEEQRLEKEKRQKRKDAAKRARDAAQRYAKLEGKGLGDADDGEALDTRTWLMQQKKRQKKIEKARQMEAELEEREREMQAQYTSKDLAGVKVGHEAAEFDELTGEQILTLKDALIGEESEDDELENQDMKAKEKLEENLRLKKKKPDYDPTEQGEAKAVLSKYDEEIEGKKQKQFTLDGRGNTAATQDVETAESRPGKGVKINLDMFVDEAPVADYLDPSSGKVKKPKKRKEKKSRQKVADEDDIFPVAQESSRPEPKNAESMEVDDVQANSSERLNAPRKRTFEFDDDDLQAKLAEQRRQALKKRKKTDAAALAKQMREEMLVDEVDAEEGGLLIDETTEFVANLRRPEGLETDENEQQQTNQSSSVKNPNGEDADGDTAMAGQSYAELNDDDEEEIKARLKREASTEATATGLDDEETMKGHGLGASLALLRKRGLVSDHAPDDLAEKDRQRSRFLAEKQHLIDDFDKRARDQREAERKSGRWEKMSHRERDAYARQQNESREHYLSRLQADMFNAQYKPDVKLQYHDEFGRSMNQKEAFKHLSHQFHGKSSGKQKTEKRLKKIDDEKKNMAKGVLNVGEEGGMMNVQGREGKRTKQAGVRLQ